MNPEASVLLPTASFPPISYFVLLTSGKKIFIEQMETFPKQTYRNRCEILTASGKLNLVVPVSKPGGNHTITKDVRLAYRERWNLHHWKSIQTAYRSSPYFNYYSDIIEPLFNRKYDTLTEYNLSALTILKKILDVDFDLEFTTDYLKDPGDIRDYRALFSPKQKMNNIFLPEYPQVFSHKFGFTRDLSILDLIFNLGPQSIDYLNKVNYA